MRPLILRAAGLALAILLAGVCWADQVTLTNGDRLTGTVQGLADGKLVLGTEYAGEIKIDLKHVASLQTDSDMTVVLDDDSRLYGTLSGDGTRLQVQTTPATPVGVEPARVSALRRGRMTGLEWRHSGRFNLGASETSGNSEVRRANLDAEWVARQYRNRFTLGGRGNYAADRGEDTEANATVYGKYDRFLTKRWYLYANTTFEHDPFKDLKLRSTLGAGSGYQFLETKRTNLSLEAGLEYVHIDFYDAPTDQYPAARLATRFDHWLWQDVMQFFHNNEFYMSLEAYENAFARTQTGLRLPLRKNFMATAQINVDWDGNPAAGRESIDRTTILSLGYRW